MLSPGVVRVDDLFPTRDTDRVAVVHRDVTVTYGELSQWADRIGHGLLDAGVAPGDRVGIAVERGPVMIAAVL